jgi:hypothetical protein
VRPLALVQVALCAILLTGCAEQAGPGVHAGDAYVVKANRTPFYTYGPAQANGPNFALTKGTRLTMLSYEYGFSHVAIQGAGDAGYVATDDLAPAPPAPKPSPSPDRSLRYIENNESRPPTPAEESRIPLPEFPESEPPPGAPPFRY